MPRTRNRSLTIEELREELRGLTWETFYAASTHKTKRATFRCTVGTHLGRPCVALISNGQFIVLRYLAEDEIFPVFLFTPEQWPVINLHSVKHSYIRLHARVRAAIPLYAQQIIKDEPSNETAIQET